MAAAAAEAAIQLSRVQRDQSMILLYSHSLFANVIVRREMKKNMAKPVICVPIPTDDQ